MKRPSQQYLRRPLLSLLLSPLLWALLSTAPLWAAEGAKWKPGRLPGDVEAAADYAHLRYFGFYASAMGNWNFTEEVAPFTNLTWIHVGSVDQPEDSALQFLERLQQAADAGVGAVLSIEPFLFTGPEGYPRGDEEIEDFLVELRARIEEAGLMDAVVMVYPKDEPFREFRRARDPDFIEQYVTGEVYEEIHEDLQQVNAVIRRVFPDRPLGVILSGYEIHHRFFSIPDSYDWVGFDCYESLFDACEDRSFVQFYGRLLGHMAPHQRLMAVPETWATLDRVGRPEWPGILQQRLDHHYEMVLSEPRFVAFVPFLWSVEGTDTEALGLKRFPDLFDGPESNGGTRLLDRGIELGVQVKEGRWRYPNLALADTEADPARPQGGVQGELISIDRQGWVYGRALDLALPYKNLRVQLLVQDARGRSVYVSDLRRTDLRAPLTVDDWPDNGVLMGTHDYREQIPAAVLARYAGQRLTVTQLTYPDGEQHGTAHRDARTFLAPFSLTPLPPPPRPD